MMERMWLYYFMQKHGIMLLIILGIVSLSIGYSAFNQNLTISGDAKVEGALYHDEVLNGADPVLQDDLIPVVIANDGTVRKASFYDKWYSYQEQKWANTVILKDESVVYLNGDIIPEENIESYFVWIPRFKYKIFDEGNYSGLTGTEKKEQTIEIIFEDKKTLVSNGSKIGEWLTHPAFTSFDSNGMWVGKFETGTTLTSDYNVRNGNAVQIKPNITSWRSIQLANAFYTSYDYKRNLDSHMMKNTEWGAVAYLQHSIYGSSQSVRINNNSSYITGYASINEPTCGYNGKNEVCNRYCNDGSCNSTYNTSIGYLASTTGNITGIYDMNGGTVEYVMGVLLDSNGQPYSGKSNKYNSGFKGKLSCPECDNSDGITEVTDGYDIPIKKYYDGYTYSGSQTSYNLRILGDATGEMGPFTNKTRKISSWYEDEATFINYEAPWFVRGGVFNGYNSGTNGGIFAFARGYGSATTFSVTPTFRIVLTPN